MKAVIYSRVSTIDKQDNTRQIKDLQEFAKGRKINVVKVFEEKISGATKAKERKVFSDLLNYIKEENIKAILIWELSRLGRSMLDVQTMIQELTDLRVNILIKKEGINTLDDNGNSVLLSKMMIGMLSAFAEFERDTTKKRSSSGLRQRASVGGAGGSILKPYGFKNVNKMLVVDEEEAEIIRYIFKTYLEGNGTKIIARLLNEKNIKTRFNKAFGEKNVKTKYGYIKEGNSYKWQDGTIYTILKNTIYFGDRVYKNEVFKVQPIVSKKTFDLVQQKLKEKSIRIDKKHENILEGLITCPKCGKNYWMHKRSNNKDNAYKCISARYKEACGNPSVNIDKLIKSLYWTLQPVILNDSMQANTDNVKITIQNKEIQLSNLNIDLTRFKKRLKKVQEEYLDDELSKTEYNKLKLDSETQINNIKSKILQTTTDLNSLLNLKDNSNKQYTFEMFKTYLRDAVKSIRVFEVVKPEKFKSMLVGNNDIPVIIQVLTNLNTPDSKEIVYHYALSRYTNNYSSVSFNKDILKIEDYQKEIEKGRIAPDVILDLKKLEPLVELQNEYFKKV